MFKLKNLKLITYLFILSFFPGTYSLFASSNYICPKPDLVAVETLKAIERGENSVTIQTDYGTLVAIIENITSVKTELENKQTPQFHHAAILFENKNRAPYDLECAYEFPALNFYMHDSRLFIGATDYYWYARGQGQEGPYAWCNGKGGGVEFCSFIDEPVPL